MQPKRLKNGSEELEPLIAVTMASLNHLMAEGYGIAVYELRQLCRNSGHKLWGPSSTTLKDAGLVEGADGDWHVHSSIRNIVLSAVTGEGMEMVVGNQLAAKAEVSTA